jgi:hypothetical protein
MCLQGSYSITSASESCQVCPNGFFSNSVGSSACIPFQGGSLTMNDAPHNMLVFDLLACIVNLGIQKSVGSALIALEVNVLSTVQFHL